MLRFGALLVFFALLPCCSCRRRVRRQALVGDASTIPRRWSSTLRARRTASWRSASTFRPRPDRFTIVYPKWIPGEHGPTGPLNDLAALRVSAGGTPLDWRRDPLDLYAFHVDVPAGARAIDVDFDVLMNAPGDVMSTHSVAIVNWNRALLYQDGVDSHQYFVKPSIVLPAGMGVCHRPAHGGAERQSHRLRGNARSICSSTHLWISDASCTSGISGATAPRSSSSTHSPMVPRISTFRRTLLRRISARAGGGLRHIRVASFLRLSRAPHAQRRDRFPRHRAPPIERRSRARRFLDRSAGIARQRRPHHARVLALLERQVSPPGRSHDAELSGAAAHRSALGLRGHESVSRRSALFPRGHSRAEAIIPSTSRRSTPRWTTRPAALRRRSSISRPARLTSIVARGDYGAIRRNANDFYTEGELLWLDVDTIIRERSHGARSLDTFLHRFTEPALTGPIVETYTRAQVEACSNEVEPYDWHAFFEKYVYHVDVIRPADELARAGWRLVYTDKSNDFITAGNADDHAIEGWYSYGAELTARASYATFARARRRGARDSRPACTFSPSTIKHSRPRCSSTRSSAR